MGIDVFEIIIRTEDKFGIFFDDKNSVWHKKDATVGNVADEVRRLIAEKARAAADWKRYSYETALSGLQNCLQEMFPQQNVSETERIADIVPYWKQRKHLAAIKKRFPEIEWKVRIWTSAILWIVQLSIVALILLKLLFSIVVFFSIGDVWVITAAVIWYVFVLLFYGLYSAFWIPNLLPMFTYGTVGDYAKQIADKQRQWNEYLEADGDKIKTEVRQIFAEVLGFPPDEIKQESLVAVLIWYS